MESEKDRVRRVLHEQLKEAIAQRKRASLAFRCIPSGPNGLIHPEVTQQFRNATREHSQALRNVARLIRLRAQHIVTGIMLEALKKDSTSPETQNLPRTLKERGDDHTD
jgi:hypothetical protein